VQGVECGFPGKGPKLEIKYNIFPTAENRGILHGMEQSFSPLQVGYIASTIQPVLIDDEVKTALDLFEANPELEALPVQGPEAVLGVVSRKIMESFSISPAYRAYQRNLNDFLIPFSGAIDASSYTAKVVDINIRIDQGKYPSWFMVLHKKQYLGVVSLQRMLEYINILRSQDLQNAGEIQKYLLEKSRSRIEDKRFNFFLFNQMAHETGGDFYHAYKSGQNSFLIACFDVSGKNLAGSMTTMALGSCFTTLENFIGQNQGRKSTTLINTLLKEINPPGVFVAAVFFYVDFDTNTVCIHNCGFSPVMIFIPRNEKIGIRIINPSFPPLGIEEKMDTENGENIPINKGLRLCVWSDGLTDMANIFGERYGEERIKEFLKKTHRNTLQDMQGIVENEISEWIGEASLADDITLADIRFS
jgi:sigma-B regulation protein RsbU (phosphoserine phosphatase)